MSSSENRKKKEPDSNQKRQSALEKLRQVKQGTIKRSEDYEPEELESIYECYDEKQYEERILRERNSAPFVIDTDGLGYVEDNYLIDGDISDEDDFDDHGLKPIKKNKVEKKRGALNTTTQRKKKVEDTSNNENVLKMFQKYPESTQSSNIQSRFSTIQPIKDFSNFEEELLKELGINDNDDDDYNNDNNNKVDHIDTNHSVNDNDLVEIKKDPFDSSSQNQSSMMVEDDNDDDLLLLKYAERIEREELWKEENAILSQTVQFQQKQIRLDEEGNLLVYWFDAAELPNVKPGVIYIFGKVFDEDDNQYKSICIIVKNIQRRIYVSPKEGKSLDEVKDEMNMLRKKYNISRFTSVNYVKKSYSFFDVNNVPKGESDYLEIMYEYDDPSFPDDIKGETFNHIFGKSSSALENFILDRKLMGPGWINIKNPSNSLLTSWCIYECSVDDPNQIENKVFKQGVSIPQIPPFSFISFKVQHSPKNQNEIIGISLMVNEHFNIESSSSSELGKMRFTLLSKLSKAPFPRKFKETIESNKYAIYTEENESFLLKKFIDIIQRYDPDFLIGHNILNHDIHILLQRMDNCNIDKWSLLGRLRRRKIPKIKSSDPSFEIRKLIIGRLPCDSYLLSMEFLPTQVNYKLSSLVQTQFNYQKKSKSSDSVEEMFEDTKKLIELCDCLSEDVFYSTKLIFKLDAIQLTKQLTNLGGNLWSKSLCGARAERIEYLLMHRFYNLNYIVPDKVKIFDKEKKTFKRGKPTYSGGKVLDPKLGFYDYFILVLDFNSLYPSIIQEYNICFTTMKRSIDHEGKESYDLPESNNELGILPQAIRELVLSRKEVKTKLERENDQNQRHKLNIKQLAIKLIANSMYGCLGFKNSRFYALPLAEYVTRKGRDALLVAEKLASSIDLDVIYGDTDSIMINTRSRDYKEVREIGTKLKKKINYSFKYLEIDIDSIFEKMLILKKKKYAALNCIRKGYSDEYDTEIIEKGLDIVRRDWCPLVKDIGHKILDILFYSKNGEDIVDLIHNYLRDQYDRMKSFSIDISKFYLTKTLKKNPKDYSDAGSQPHVKVALDMMKENKNVYIGQVIEYVICKSDNDNHRSFAERAKEACNIKYDEIDLNWYILNQVYPPIMRLCQHIDGTDADMLAKCLGIDISKDDNHHISSSNDENSFESRYPSEIHLKIHCVHCYKKTRVNNLESNKAICEHCTKKIELSAPYLTNQILLYIRSNVNNIYQSKFSCIETNGVHESKHQYYIKKDSIWCMKCLDNDNVSKMNSKNTSQMFISYLNSFMKQQPFNDHQYTITKTKIHEYELLNEYGMINLKDLFKSMELKFEY